MLLQTIYAMLKEKESQLRGEFLLEEDSIRWVYGPEGSDEEQRWDAYCEVRKEIEPRLTESGCRIVETGDYDGQAYFMIQESMFVD